MPTTPLQNREVFVSYASRDLEQVKGIISCLKDQNITFWRDQDCIAGSTNYGPEIVSGIENCKIVLLMCSSASLRSRNVKQEIQLAWAYEKPYLPLIIDDSLISAYPKQVQYWLEGCQWIRVHGRSAEEWVPDTLRSLQLHGIGSQAPVGFTPQAAEPEGLRTKVDLSLETLRKMSSFTDLIWPVAAESAQRGHSSGSARGLGAPQPDVKHGHRLGSRLRLVIESEQAGHLLLLDQGPEGITYCLCPSLFAPDSSLDIGRSVLPQPQSPYDSFVVSGVPGREQILAIVTKQPLDLGWASQSSDEPARTLSPEDERDLISRLRALDPEDWASYSTYFEIVT